MAKINCKRKNCKDVFKSFLVEKARFDGDLEIPKLKRIPHNVIPKHLILFSDKKCKHDKYTWLCFFEDDQKINALWNNPRKYVNLISTFGGIITPDYSLYRDMPLIMQLWNIYRSRALGVWLQDLGFNVIPNVRWGDERTYDICCLGIEIGSTIAVGTHGLMKIKEERKLFSQGFDYIVEKLKPKSIIVYGTTPEDVFGKHIKNGIDIISFPSKISKAHKGGVA